MAYPTKLNDQYKAEKAAGLTTAPSFTAWMRSKVVEPVVESQTPILDELIKTFTNEPTSEELEAELLAAPLTQEQVDSIVATLNPTPVAEPTTDVSKAAIARAIYDQMAADCAKNNTALVRKNLINAFMVGCPISKNGASTYLQNIKKAKGLINSK